MKTLIKEIIQESIRAKQALVVDEGFLSSVCEAVDLICKAYENKNKVLVFGNGGSAADAQHFAAEMVNRFKIDRIPLPALSLTTDTSIISSIANDSGYDRVFSKQIEALGVKGDIALAITTSDIESEKGGHSANIYYGLVAAREKGITTIGLVSKKSKKILELLDLAIVAPSDNTPRIQEIHAIIIHIICEIVEKNLFSK